MSCHSSQFLHCQMLQELDLLGVTAVPAHPVHNTQMQHCCFNDKHKIVRLSITQHCTVMRADKDSSLLIVSRCAITFILLQKQWLPFDLIKNSFIISRNNTYQLKCDNLLLTEKTQIQIRPGKLWLMNFTTGLFKLYTVVYWLLIQNETYQKAYVTKMPIWERFHD